MTSGEWSTTDSMVLQILASMLASQNREQKAADLLEYLLTREPENTEVLRALCGVYLMLERYEEALTTVERYERLVPKDGNTDDVMLVKGQALWELGHSSEATSVMNDYLTRNENK